MGNPDLDRQTDGEPSTVAPTPPKEYLRMGERATPVSEAVREAADKIIETGTAQYRTPVTTMETLGFIF